MESAVDKQPANDLSNQIMGLKKVAAANRTKGSKAHPKEQPVLMLEDNIAIQNQAQLAQDQNQFGTRSSSHGRLSASQQPRQGGIGQARTSKNRKSLQGAFLEESQQYNSNYNNNSSNSNEGDQIPYQFNEGENKSELEQKRSRARLRELHKHIDMNINSALQQKKASSTTRQNPNDEVIVARSVLGTANKNKRQESSGTRKSQQFQAYESFSQVASTAKGTQNQGNFFKHQNGKANGGARKSNSTGRSGLPKGNNINLSSSKRQMKEHSNQILGLVAAQSMRYQSQINNMRHSNDLPMNTSFYQPNPNSVPQRKQQDLYKVYMSSHNNNQQTQPTFIDSSQKYSGSSQTPLSGGQTTNVQIAPNQSQDLTMLNRHNNLVQKNRKSLQQQTNPMSSQQQQQFINIGGEQLPMINNPNNNTGPQPIQNIIHKQMSENSQTSPHNTQNFAPYASMKNAIKNIGQRTSQIQQVAIGSQGSNSKMSTMAYQTTHYKMNGISGINPNATTQVHYNTNSLEQYNNHQFASINQSALIRNLNYSILQGELENEAALEDMHMFFVAFNKRQKRIVEVAEHPILSKKELDVNAVEGTVDEHELLINVTVLDEEIDIE